MQTVLRSVLVGAGVLAFVSGAAVAHAQTAPAVSDETFTNGRFELYDATPVGPDGRPTDTATLMVDTAFGRSWMLVREPDGRVIWERLWVKKSDVVPDDGLRRPQSVR